MSHVKKKEGDQQSVTLCDKGGEILHFVTLHFCCFNLIISRRKIAKYVMSHQVGGPQKYDQL